MKSASPSAPAWGDGSSDAAAVLRALNGMLEAGYGPLALARLGEAVGSDVPYCVLGGTALAEGRGERLTALSVPDAVPHRALQTRLFSISTPELFHRIDQVKLHFHPDTPGVIQALEQGDLPGVSRRMFNVFEEVLPSPRRAVVEEIKQAMLSQGALGACMSGTGPTVFGIFAGETEAEAAWRSLKESYDETFLTHSV